MKNTNEVDEDLKLLLATEQVKAFNEGYQLGRQIAEQIIK
jgi:hypothetical protein